MHGVLDNREPVIARACVVDAAGLTEVTAGDGGCRNEPAIMHCTEACGVPPGFSGWQPMARSVCCNCRMCRGDAAWNLAGGSEAAVCGRIAAHLKLIVLPNETVLAADS